MIVFRCPYCVDSSWLIEDVECSGANWVLAIADCSSQEADVVAELREPHIAAVAEEASDRVRLMAMIHV